MKSEFYDIYQCFYSIFLSIYDVVEIILGKTIIQQIPTYIIMKNYHDKKLPGESDAYREARNELLEAEINLRRQTEEVAALRRSLPDSAKVKEDYIFEEKDASGNTRHTRLSELFEDGKDSLIIYSFMFGPQNEKPCTSCTSILDGINGMVFHAEQRVNIAIVAKAPGR
jgi:predicted dithiol-disulfide oxidoreductase (DUF899 family)